jgi:sulfur-oxidizing protein SoxZ
VAQNQTAAAIRIRAKSKEGSTEVLVLMKHPMETGLRKSGSGELIPAHYITDAQVWCEGRIVFAAKLSIAVAKDPLLSFRFEGGRPGDRLRVTWRDNLGEQRTDVATIG